jgi:two-component system alkaline phosphatase synthesis response regulator PhoP
MTRILLVEDEPSIVLVLEDDLRREGYEVEVAGDGETALRRGREGDFDLILLDVMLPRKDGFEVCRELRRGGVETPVLMLTALAHESEKVVGLDSGADDYVTKPYGARELRARIRALLRRREAGRRGVVRFGECELDTERCELRRAGVAVDLTPLEYKLLAVFARRQGRLLSRQQLLDAAWGRGTHITERAVDNQVTNLRKKMEPDPERPRFLVSVRGLGYRFDGEAVTE